MQGRLKVLQVQIDAKQGGWYYKIKRNQKLFIVMQAYQQEKYKRLDNYCITRMKDQKQFARFRTAFLKFFTAKACLPKHRKYLQTLNIR